MKIKLSILFVLLFVAGNVWAEDEKGLIEQQLEEIGAIANEEIIVVQPKYTRKKWRHELTALGLGGIPFGTVRRTLMGGAGYTLHFNDWFAWEAFNFLYSRNFFSAFTDNVNANNSGPDIVPDVQKLLFGITTGFQITPFYGKMSTFSRFISYIEPIFTFGAGMAKTETQSYLTFYPGAGLRVFFKEWVSMRFDFRNYLYTEKFTNRSTGAEDSTLRSNYSVMLSLSFWLPKMPR